MVIESLLCAELHAMLMYNHFSKQKPGTSVLRMDFLVYRWWKLSLLCWNSSFLVNKIKLKFSISTFLTHHHIRQWQSIWYFMLTTMNILIYTISFCSCCFSFKECWIFHTLPNPLFRAGSSPTIPMKPVSDVIFVHDSYLYHECLSSFRENATIIRQVGP